MNNEFQRSKKNIKLKKINQRNLQSSMKDYQNKYANAWRKQIYDERENYADLKGCRNRKDYKQL